MFWVTIRYHCTTNLGALSPELRIKTNVNVTHRSGISQRSGILRLLIVREAVKKVPPLLALPLPLELNGHPNFFLVSKKSHFSLTLVLMGCSYSLSLRGWSYPYHFYLWKQLKVVLKIWAFFTNIRATLSKRGWLKKNWRGEEVNTKVRGCFEKFRVGSQKSRRGHFFVAFFHSSIDVDHFWKVFYWFFCGLF